VQDWSHFTVDSRYDLAQNASVDPTTNQTFGGPVLMENGLINGKNIWNGPAQNDTPVGERYVVPTQFVPGTTYLLRFINIGIQSTIKVYLDGHTFTVIANDFVPIVPYQTDILNINIGQRYMVLVTANQTPDNYFLRADFQTACSGTIQALDVKAIVNYAGFSGTPTSTAYNYTNECVDEPLASLVPVVPLNVGPADVTEGTFDVVVQANPVNLFKWYISGTTFFSEYNEPTLLDIFENNTLPDISGSLQIDLPTADEMVYVIIESPIPLPHPIHLHGHDFWVLASGTGSYDSTVVLNLQNPPRRDTALMPTAGYLVLAFITDNPGVWLMHCHIGWHTS
jgi:FtsP/CotA-like multicopper oxidase with cupredoxin domain